MDLGPLLRNILALNDLPQLLAALGHEPLQDEVPAECWGRRPPHSGVVLALGRRGEFPWFGLSGPAAEQDARAVARRLVARGRVAGVLGLEPERRRLTVAVAFNGVPAISLALDHPDGAALAALGRLTAQGEGGALAFAARAAEALSGETVGLRFFREFRATLERMAAGLPGPLGAGDRHDLALLQLTRILFLYFVAAKGWLAGRERFLSEEVDRCLARKGQIHRHLLRPLFFGTLNRPIAERTGAPASFGPIPFLNGGLFEPHPLERRLRDEIGNEVWRDAFDHLFERFHFTVAERGNPGAVAPDMLGRVFEGVMAPDQRRASGTFYTPAALVDRLLDAGCTAAVAGRLGWGESEAERRLASGDPVAMDALARLTVLDPAVGSGAFLLGALERLAGAGLRSPRDLTRSRRLVLQRSLFGVDLSATAVRLTELRLWLAVIADDVSERPAAVQPLPNLDCLVRQGDSLFEPMGWSPRRGAAAAGAAREIAALRRRVVAAAGVEKRPLLRALRIEEARAARESLAKAGDELREEIARLLREARGSDLFGRRRGLDRAGREALLRARGELRAVRQADRVIVREGAVPWFHYQTHFADVFAVGGFDLVAGNPPWLRAEELPPETRRRLAGRYRWWRAAGGSYGNRPDLAVAFLERALELCAPGGVVALLVPAKLATTGHAAAARHGLATTTTLLRLADLTGRPEAAFDATVFPLAVVTRRSPPAPGHRVCTTLDPGATGQVRQSSLRGGGPWILTTTRAQRALAALTGDHPRLDQQVTCHLGVKTGANRIFLRPPATVEPELLRWAVRGRDLRPFQAAPRVQLLWTHGTDGRPLSVLPSGAAAYLKPHAGALTARADFAGGPAWSLFRVGPATAPHRVVWADLARHLSAAALTGPADRALVPLNTCYVARAATAQEAERIAAWLNSSWIRAAARASAVPAASGFARFTATTVGALPLPATTLSDPDLPLLARAGRNGEPVQDHLDELCARHLGIGAAARDALRALLASGTVDRG